VTIVGILSGILAEETEENHEKIQSSRSPDRDFDPRLLEYEGKPHT
jgi:hypothetical protein